MDVNIIHPYIILTNLKWYDKKINIEHFKTFFILRLELLLLKFWLWRSVLMLFMHYGIIFPFKDKHGMKKPKTSVPKNIEA